MNWPSRSLFSGPILTRITTTAQTSEAMSPSQTLNNTGGSWYVTYPQISNHDDTPIEVTDSTIE